MQETTHPRPPTAGRLEARKQRTRAAILAAAAELFTRQGYEATTMQEIATLAETGLGTVYGYFPSKEEMLRTVLDGRRRIAVQRSTAIVRQAAGAVQRTCLILRHLWEFLAENRALSLALISINASHPGTQQPDQDSAYVALVTQLQRGRERGELGAIPIETAAKSLLSSYTWAALGLGIWQHAEHPDAVLADLELLTLRLLTPHASSD